MLMADMHPGDIARVVKCIYPGVPENSYQGALVLRTHNGVWAVIDGKEHITGRNMRGDTFARNATTCYEMELVTVDINIFRPPGKAKNPEPLIDMGPGWHGNTPNGPWEGD